MILVWSITFFTARIPPEFLEENTGRCRLTVQHKIKESKSTRALKTARVLRRVCRSFSHSRFLEAPKSMVVGQRIFFFPLFITVNVRFGISHQYWICKHHVDHKRIQKNTSVYLHNSETSCHSYFIKLSFTNYISLPL